MQQALYSLNCLRGNSTLPRHHKLAAAHTHPLAPLRDIHIQPDAHARHLGTQVPEHICASANVLISPSFALTRHSNDVHVAPSFTTDDHLPIRAPGLLDAPAILLLLA